MPAAGTHAAASSNWRHTSSGGRPLFAAASTADSAAGKENTSHPAPGSPVVALFVEAAQQRDLHLRIQAHVVLPSARAAGGEAACVELCWNSIQQQRRRRR